MRYIPRNNKEISLNDDRLSFSPRDDQLGGAPYGVKYSNSDNRCFSDLLFFLARLVDYFNYCYCRVTHMALFMFKLL